MNTDKQTMDALIKQAQTFVDQSRIGRTTARELDQAILLIRRLVAVAEQAHAPTVIEPSAHDDGCEADWGPEGQESPCRCAERLQREPTDEQRETAMDEAWGFRAETRPVQEKWNAQHWFDAGWRAALRAAGGVR